jgi:hypothetical protein
MKQKKIYWRIGQEITPETFIQADNYVAGQHSLIRRLIAQKSYGLLPPVEASPDDDSPAVSRTTTLTSSLTVKADLNNGEIRIGHLECIGTTDAGYLIDFENIFLDSLPKKQLPVPTANAAAYYLVLRINPFEQTLIEPVEDEEAPQAHSFYELAIKELEHIGADELALLKINNRTHSPEIDATYIPPCMSVNACANIVETCRLFRNLFAEIRKHIEQKRDRFDPVVYPLAMLGYELDEFPSTEPPIALVRLIRKIILTCRFFIPEVGKINLPDSSATYNHNDVSIIFNSLLSSLQTIIKIVGQDVEEEDFTPKI